jgi:hypothetical protein
MAAEDIINKASAKTIVSDYKNTALSDAKAQLFSRTQIPDEAHAALSVWEIKEGTNQTLLFALDDFIIVSIREADEERNNPVYTLGPTIVTTSGGGGESVGGSGRLFRNYSYTGYLLAQDSLNKTFSRWVDAWKTYFSSDATASDQTQITRYETRLSYLKKTVKGHVTTCQIGADAQLPGVLSISFGIFVTDVT